MKTLLYANRAEPQSISVISILLLSAAADITKLRCMHRECYIFFFAKSLVISYKKNYSFQASISEKYWLNMSGKLPESKGGIPLQLARKSFSNKTFRKWDTPFKGSR